MEILNEHIKKCLAQKTKAKVAEAKRKVIELKALEKDLENLDNKLLTMMKMKQQLDNAT